VRRPLHPLVDLPTEAALDLVAEAELCAGLVAGQEALGVRIALGMEVPRDRARVRASDPVA
jgi:hypothetical protein